MLSTIEGIGVPDSKIASEITELVRDTESPLLYHHSRPVYYWGALSGQRRGLAFDPELLYAGAMFHDMGLTPRHRSPDKRFEVDGANAARTFLRAHAIAQRDIDTVWTAIALHTTPSIPEYMHPVVALVTAGMEMDVLGLGYDTFCAAERDAVVRQHPRGDHFKDNIIQAFYDGIHQKPATTFGNVKADVQPPLPSDGDAAHWDHRVDDDHWEQPGNLFRLMTREQQQLLFDNTARALGGAAEHIQGRHVENCSRADAAYGTGVAKALWLLRGN